MIDDARYPDDDFDDDQSQHAIDERVAIVKAAFAIKHQTVDKSSALRLVLNRAHDDAVGAVMDLISADPGDATAIRDLQWKIGRYDAMCTYINEVLVAGDEAADALTDEQAERLSELNENMLKGEQEAIDD